MLWLVDDNAYASADQQYDAPVNVKRKSLAMAECAIYNSRRLITPLHLGLAVQLHHEHGKRTIIDTLHAHGFCLAYDDLRKFTTAVAEDQVSKINEAAYVPCGIIPIDSGGSLIQEGDDNIDINAETIDGKNTFHSMARAVFQHQPADHPITEGRRIPRGSDRALQINDQNRAILAGCLPFDKPKQRKEPPRVPNAVDLINSCECHDQDRIDVPWVMLRMMTRNSLPLEMNIALPDVQNIPFWTGFNANLSEKSETATVAAYPPIIEAAPADMSTVYSTMVKCRNMTQHLGQSNCVQTMDQQLYAIAQQVKWSKPQELESNVLRLGGFHGMCAFIASIGKLWAAGGLKDLLVDSDVYAENTVDQMLAGKQFFRAVRGITLAYECLMQFWLSSFLEWCASEKCPSQMDTEIPHDVKQMLEAAHVSFGSIEADRRSSSDAVTLLHNAFQQHMFPLFDLFVEWACKESPTFRYWNMFLDAASIMLLNIRAERQGNWQMHLHTTRLMIPYYFAANRSNYSRWTPLYLLDMAQLPPEIKTAFQEGQFTVRRRAGRFNGIWSDMGTETTIIRDAKGDSGVIGLTRKQPSLVRWTLTRQIMGRYASIMRQRNGQLGKETEKHEEERPAAMKRDEEHVQAMTSHVVNNMTNPFDVESHPEGVLINISTGLHSPPDVQASLLEAVDKGNDKFNDFVKATLSDTGSRSFYTPISRSGLKTFSDVSKKTPLISAGKTKDVTIGSELVFRRALTLSKTRGDATMKTVLSRPVTSIPTALFHEDGTMRKNTKADLTHKLEEHGTGITCIPVHAAASTVYIRDAMSILQAMTGDVYKSFDQLADSYMASLLRHFNGADTVIEVYDRYDNKDSVKAAERLRRQTQSGVGRQYQVIAGRSVPPWKKFMALPTNKESLVKYLCQYLVDHAPSSDALASKPNRKLVMSGGFTDGSVTMCVSSAGATVDETLKSNQEEADTRMLLHAMSQDKNFVDDGRVIIRTLDTDVVVLSVHYYPQMKHVTESWIETGSVTRTADRRRYIPIHDISKSLGSPFCDILPAVHALTGCDSVSSFAGIGKVSVINCLKSNGPEQFADLTGLSGNEEQVALNAARKLIATLYDPKGNAAKYQSSLDELRYRLATTKEIPLAKLPLARRAFSNMSEGRRFKPKSGWRLMFLKCRFRHL
ncbi:MAG: hypothetical protein ABW185_00005 [Sedimenticola sp.]